MQPPFALSDLPTDPGCYLYKDVNGAIIYIGKAKNLRKRVGSYFTKQHNDMKTGDLVQSIADVEVIITNTESESLLLESKLIRQHKPKFNIHLRDMKRYAYIEVTQEDYPRIRTARVKPKHNATYGPFTDGTDRRRIIRTLNGAFQLRACKVMPQKVCFYYHIGRCCGPCEGHVSKDDYQERIQQAQSVLEGKSDELAQRLEQQMRQAAAKQEFELAKLKRDQLWAIQRVNDKQRAELSVKYNQDVIAYVRTSESLVITVLFIRKGTITGKENHRFDKIVGEVETLLAQFIQQYYIGSTFPGEIIVERLEESDRMTLTDTFTRQAGHNVKVHVPQRGAKFDLVQMAKKNAHYAALGTDRSLLLLQDKLRLPELPSVIECFDISTLQGKDTVASMVQFRDGVADTSNYRRFRIHVEGQDDFASMQEVVRRRYRRLLDENAELPTLIVIDGGKGQLHAAQHVLVELGVRVPIISLAKREEEIYVPGLDRPLRLDKKHDGLKLLQRIRDEAHRFAVTYHKKRREMRMREEFA